MKKGYLLADGYMGWVESEHQYKMFPTESEYNEYVKDKDSIFGGTCNGNKSKAQR